MVSIIAGSISWWCTSQRKHKSTDVSLGVDDWRSRSEDIFSSLCSTRSSTLPILFHHHMHIWFPSHTHTFKHSLLTTHWRLAARSCRNLFFIQHCSLWKPILDPGTRSDPIGAIYDPNKQKQVRVARPSAHVKVADIDPVQFDWEQKFLFRITNLLWLFF